jgi:hypothetical protein
MEIAKASVKADLVLSLALDETDGVIAITTSHSAPVNLRTTLAYQLTVDEARRLAASLIAWADSRP